MEGVAEVLLPFSIERLLEEICLQKGLEMPDVAARKTLSRISEESAIDVMKRVSSTRTPIYNLSGYIVHLVNRHGSLASTSARGDAESMRLSSPYPSSPSSSASSTPRRTAYYDSPSSKQFFESPCSCKSASPVIPQYRAPTNGSHGSPVQEHTSSFSCSSLKGALPNYWPSVDQPTTSPTPSSKGTNPNHVSQRYSGPENSSQTDSPSYYISDQALVLSGLEFRRLFMVHSYIGSKKLEDALSLKDAVEIDSMKTMTMFEFEDWIWSKYGCHYCQPSDRSMYLEWDSGKTHLYSCYVSSDGSYKFKGPYLDSKKTHLQRALGDENVLIVKFAEFDKSDMMAVRNYGKIVEEGILVGLRRYRLFVFKDGGKERTKNGKDDKKKGLSGSIKCYFVKRESIDHWDDKETFMMNCKTIHDARCLFMHVHMVSSMAKYIARFSLILSTTIKIQVNLASVSVEEIDDIPCIDENGYIVCDEDGEPLIQTDGTGFISEDLAALVPYDFYDAKYIKDKSYEKFDLVKPEIGSTGLGGGDVLVKDPPLLIQCRLYNKGLAVKGTLLVNKRLNPRTIQVRPSMIKVRQDPRFSDKESFNSLEVVAVSHKPKAAKLSKHLIALLSIGGVPKSYFLGLLETTLKDTQRVCSDPRAAFRVANIYQQIDDSGMCIEMFGARIPLNEPYFQYRLSQLSKEERKGLGDGKIPISDSFYLMGTTDPTGILNPNEVCIILENGQISGKVLVYRNPGLHFGDIHVLNARYVKELEDYIGNGKFAIFFSTKGKRSVANEIANGDFDGDMYWVSKNHQLLTYFDPSEPWKRSYSTPSGSHKKPSDFSYEELEHELFKLLFSTKTHNEAAGIAADSWLAFMDRYLILQDDDDVDEKLLLEGKMLKLIDLYYDALDAPKSGKKVVIPRELKATQYPHHMGRRPEYHSWNRIRGLFGEGHYGHFTSWNGLHNWRSPIGIFGSLESTMHQWGRILIRGQYLIDLCIQKKGIKSWFVTVKDQNVKFFIDHGQFGLYWVSEFLGLCSLSCVLIWLIKWSNTLGAYLVSPAMGAHFVMYIAKMQESSKSGLPPKHVERFIFVVQGFVTLTNVSGSCQTLTVDWFAYLPPNTEHQFESYESATLVVFERRYAYLEDYIPEPIVGSTNQQPLLDTPGEVFQLRKLLPTSLPYDFNIHIMDFQPGEFLNVKEVHYNQHGLLLLEGQGIYRLGDSWYPVEAGDVIWMAPFVPQWYAALGKIPTRYLLYKDVNRNPL